MAGNMTGGRLTTHVLDTARGKPAAGVKIWLYRVSGNSHKKIAETVTNADGRTDAPMLTGPALPPAPTSWCSMPATICAPPGRRRARCCSWTRSRSASACRMRASIYHVPLLISPFAYSTYRGS